MKSTLRILFLPLALLCAAHAFSQNQPISLYGRVVDEITRKPVPGLRAAVMRADSTVIDTLRADDSHNQGGYNFVVYGAGTYLLRFRAEGYEEKWVRQELKGKRLAFFQMDKVGLHRDMSRQLGEAVVRATQIKMVMRGDTVVYNADAFQLAEGSMLDRLVEMLPGVELHAGGRITVNGEPVSSLLLNGKDFFKGDPKMALQNLPAYMVKNLKVYRKDRDDAYIVKPREGEEKPLVMDVNLRREFNVGWTANAEGGYGTSDRYAARAFGMRFSDRSRLTAYGNLNNMNATGKPGQDGAWQLGSSNGTTYVKQGGVDYYVAGRDNLWNLTGNASAKHTDHRNRYTTSSVSFLAGGDTYSRDLASYDGCDTEVRWNQSLTLRKPRLYFNFSPMLTWQRSSVRTLNRTATFSGDPADSYRLASLDSVFDGMESPRLAALLVNRTEDKGLQEREYFNLDGALRFTFNSPRAGDYFKVFANGYYRHSSSESFSQYDLRYGQSGTQDGGSAADDYRNRYHRQPSTAYHFDGDVMYAYRDDFARIEFQGWYGYRQSYSTRTYDLNRLDSLKGAWAAPGGTGLGVLPSVSDWPTLCRDIANSYWSTGRDYEHRVTVVFTKWGFAKVKGKREGTISVTLPVTFRRDELDYRRARLDTAISRRVVVFEPSLFFDIAYRYGLRYNCSVRQPDMTYRLGLRDDEDPLAVFLGNPTLKATVTHTLNPYWNVLKDQEHQRNLTLRGTYTVYVNQIAQAALYNRATGGYTYRPENINGNFQTGGSIYYTEAIDKKRRLQLTSNTGANYTHNVDYISIAGQESAARSSVRNLSLNENLRLSYTLGKHRIEAKATTTWWRSTSRREDFRPVSAVDFSYGMSARVALPWKLELATDLNVYSRRGYADRTMNTNDVVWNARLSRTFLGGRLTCLVDGYDILGQLPYVYQSINGQGRREVHFNSLHQYVMAKVILKLSKKPKNK